MNRAIYIALLSMVLFGCQRPDVTLTVRECAPMPVARACATAFVVDGKAYVFAGRDSAGISHNDLWCYTPSTDRWENAGATPLTSRVHATACVNAGKVYLGLGFQGEHGVDSCYLRDYWEYTPATGVWRQLADYPNAYTNRATSFVGDDELYVGYGFCWNYRRDMFRYSIADDRWDSIDVGVAFQGYPTRSFGGTGCTCRGRHFMGTGFFRKSVNWWAELVDGTHWEQRAEVPGRTRTLAATAATDRYVYLCGGIHYGGVNTSGEVLTDVRRYNPDSDEWQYVARMPQGLINHVCFAVNGKVYFGLGENDNWQVQNKLYCIEE